MVAIIGGGPVGCYSAHLLAKAGLDVSLYEEHAKIGEPVQCTGILTSHIGEIVKLPDSCIVNKIREAEIVAPNGFALNIRMQSPDIIVDRAAFDRYMAEMAASEGATIHTNAHFIRLTGSEVLVRDKKNSQQIKDMSRQVIGADGPMSSVSKSAMIHGNREFLKGIQAVVKLKNDNIVKFYPHIGTFGWIVPESSNMARIGLLGRRDTVGDFERFLKHLGIHKKDIVTKQGGVVPIYNPELSTYTEMGEYDVYLVGDAAGHVKATTGGGVVPGLRAAKALRNSIVNENDYVKGWKKAIGKELWVHRKARHVMDNFSVDDWNDFIGIFDKKKNRQILGSVSRDNMIGLMIKLGLREPRLWKYGMKVF